MSNTIQHYSFNDTSSYGQSLKLSTDINTLNEKQNEGRKGSFAVINSNDAVAIEISELARTLYASSSNAIDKYEGLSNAEREQKELEDYIASHPADSSIDLLRNGRISEQVNANTVNLVDEALITAEKEYKKSFIDAAKDFANFSGKITYGDYDSNDVSVSDLNFDTIDKMQDIYQSYKDQIQSNYEGDERTKYLKKLDEVYNTVFSEKIIDPVKNAYDDKLTFFQPDSEESMKSIKAAASSKESLQEMISGYMTNQSLKKIQYSILSDGTKDFYNMANDTSLWHDSTAVKNILTDTMNSYSSVKEINTNSSAYSSAKEAADAIAKKISDKYAESLEYKAEKLGLTKNGEHTEWSQIVNNYMTNTSSEMFMIDFSKITELSFPLEIQ